MSGEPSDLVELGEVIGGYRLERLLGAGSTSQVFLGKHVVLGRKAAIKLLIHSLIGNEDVISRLLTEAKVVNDIRHPNIVDITDFINTTAPRRVALVMEHVEGPSLAICREHPLTFEQAIGVMLQLVAAVRAAHDAGVIHRDLKPDNLLLTVDPREKPNEVPTLKIVDFGIAKMAHSNSPLTAVGTMLGTPAYMAPEQIAGRPRPSAATDVFAIGEVLYEVLTGRRAYPAATISETVRAKLRGELPELEMPSIPGRDLWLDLIKRCLAQRPEDRPALGDIQTVLERLRPVNQPSMLDGATTELSTIPIGEAHAETLIEPLPRRADLSSPTNRILPALTELIPNAPTVAGSLDGARPNERSVRLSVMFEDEDPLRIEPMKPKPNLGLGAPAGIALDAADLEREIETQPPFDDPIDGAATMPPPDQPRNEAAKERAVSGPDIVDTRITRVPAPAAGSNRMWIVLIGALVGVGLILLAIIANGRFD